MNSVNESRVGVSRSKLPLNAFRAFEIVARTGSFRAGADALNVTQSALSRHVTILEAMIGQPLFTRLSRGIEMTEAGRALLAVVTDSLDALEEVVASLQGRTRLRLHIPPGLFHSISGSFIREFHTENPGVLVDFTSTYGEGVLMAGLDLAVAFDASGVDLPGRVLLWDIRVTPVCAPGDVIRFRDLGLEGVLASDALFHVRVPGHRPALLWSRFAMQCGYTLAQESGLVFETIDLAVNSAAKGGGLALADVDLFADRITSGELATPFGLVQPIGFSYYLQIDPARSLTPEIRKLRRVLIERLGKTS
jgi:LysR family glycine cleavage system transcriptional activator